MDQSEMLTNRAIRTSIDIGTRTLGLMNVCRAEMENNTMGIPFKRKSVAHAPKLSKTAICAFGV